MSKILAVMALAVCLLCLFALTCHAAEKTPTNQTPEGGKSDLALVGIALAAALAVGMCAIATGIAQSRIGAAGCGTIAEKPETAGTMILMIAIPETMVILGFVVAVVMLFAL